MGLFAVVGEYGEYENYNRRLCGVFATLDEASDAIKRAVLEGPKILEAWYSWDKRREEFLKTCAPERDEVWASGFHYVSYASDDYTAARASAGPEPKTMPNYDKWAIYDVSVGQWLFDDDPVETINKEEL